jgi:anhydro-N-acetylmuramic acid kinase
MLVIGLMSGTSVDAIDGALVRCNDAITELGFASLPIESQLCAEVLALQQRGDNELERAALAANRLADSSAAVVSKLLGQTGLRVGQIAAIGAHGQTVRHRPDAGFTIQINNAARLSELTGIRVIADFRSRDVAAGGQGAPLVPAFHRFVFADPHKRRAVVNIGGIANISIIGATAASGDDLIAGYDCGPGNLLLDAWCLEHTGARYDAGGVWAASGKVDSTLLTALRDDEWLRQPGPKSTGRDQFNRSWLDTKLQPAAHRLRPEDVQATLLEFSASEIARAIHACGADEAFLCGGGAFNDKLKARIAQLVAPTPLATTTQLGIDPQHVEACAFAWLAAQHVRSASGNLPSVTGARGARVLGASYPA